ncbi:MAG: methyltransferase domain-containing protein [Pseudomonadota bacterium]
MAALACPRCDQALTGDAGSLHCNACEVTYPALDGVPWLFAEPAAALADWRQRAGFAMERLQERSRRAAEALGDGAAGATATRLMAERDGCDRQSTALGELLAPLLENRARLDYATYLALRTRLPSDQGLNTYLPNLFRDWAWGDDENAASLELSLEALGDASGGVGKVLVLGAGAARLAHDLTLALRPGLAVALDFNPLLLLAAKRITGGGAVTLTEFPLAPRRLADHSIERTLAAATASKLTYVLGDVLRAPFRPGHFDLVVTPWLIDIVDEPLDGLLPRINRLLASGGIWLNVGSLAFRHADPRYNYSYEETLERIGTAGFAAPDVVERELPYMRSPSSRHARSERMLAFAAEKTAAAADVPRYRALPDWLVTGKAPVPAGRSFQVQAASTRVHAFIMALIDGRRSLNDMAAIMEQRGLMPADQARDAIRGFLIKMYDDSKRYSAL